MNEILTPILARLTRGNELSADEIDAAAGEIFEGRVSEVQAAGFIVALRTKGETADELAALVRAMQRFGTPVTVPDGAIDTCGTGGDRSGTVNVSTMAALIAAGAGASVVKHGNRAQSSKAGSADVFEALGVAIDLGPAGVERCVEEAGVGFCFAPRYHPAMRFLGPARKELAVPTTFNFLGPLANPARVRRQAVGVSDPEMATRMLGTLRALGTERAMVFSGDDGLDELTTTTTSTVHELIDGNLHEFKIDPLDVGIARSEAAQLCGGDAATNAGVLLGVLAGEAGPCRDIAVLNAAAALMVAGKASDLAGGVEMAIAAVDSGAANRALESLVRVSQSERAAEQENA
ncbi:MAG: anthranilate phosphoribosyltransferase [Actinomycetota bacterium]|jgi:anthranilate phosphoribosyltransferase|nr:anthranilate phosphoribosyltransferase [Actinomycetota bacterium]